MSATCIIAFDYEDPSLPQAEKDAAFSALAANLLSTINEDIRGPSWLPVPDLGRQSTGTFERCLEIRDAIYAFGSPFTITACGDPTALVAEVPPA